MSAERGELLKCPTSGKIWIISGIICKVQFRHARYIVQLSNVKLEGRVFTSLSLKVIMWLNLRSNSNACVKVPIRTGRV